MHGAGGGFGVCSVAARVRVGLVARSRVLRVAFTVTTQRSGIRGDIMGDGLQKPQAPRFSSQTTWITGGRNGMQQENVQDTHYCPSWVYEQYHSITLLFTWRHKPAIFKPTIQLPLSSGSRFEAKNLLPNFRSIINHIPFFNSSSVYYHISPRSLKKNIL